jgi:hypothetical protein
MKRYECAEARVELLGRYDVVVVGAGISGVIAAVRAAREGASTLLLEGSGTLGGMITGGRMTKPTGLVNGGLFNEMFDRCARYGGGDKSVRKTYWGSYSGMFDAEVMQRVVIEVLDEAGVDILLRATAVDCVMSGTALSEIVIQAKSGRKRIAATIFVDASGDGDIAALAGADFMLGRSSDGAMQPISTYVRIINVDIPKLYAFCGRNRNDLEQLLPPGGGATNDDFVLKFHASGFTGLIEQAQSDGFPWILPRNHMILRAGLIPGEIIVNITRFHGNALDERVLSRAEIEVRRQAYCAFDFFRRYLPGFETSIFLETSPKLGVRETRRIVGDYILTESDVVSNARFEDAIGLCNAPIDIHDPAGGGVSMRNIGEGYGIPFRCLLPKGIDGLLTAGRCISVDEIAFGSTRNTPACAMTGEAAGIAAALAANTATKVRAAPVAPVQSRLQSLGVQLGNQ